MWSNIGVNNAKCLSKWWLFATPLKKMFLKIWFIVCKVRGEHRKKIETTIQFFVGDEMSGPVEVGWLDDHHRWPCFFKASDSGR